MSDFAPSSTKTYGVGLLVLAIFVFMIGSLSVFGYNHGWFSFMKQQNPMTTNTNLVQLTETPATFSSYSRK